MDPSHQQAMEALGRPKRASVPPPSASPRGRRRLENDIPMLLLALTIGAVNGYATGMGLVDFSFVILALPLVVAVAGALKLGRSLLAALISGLAGVMLSCLLAVILTIGRILDGLW